MATVENVSGFKTLNIVFHGTFAFWVKTEGIEVLIPSVKMHAYYAGTWQQGKLQPLEQGLTYTLNKIPVQGTSGPPAEFDRDANLCVQGTPTAGNDTIRLVLPRPKQIETLQHMTLQSSNFVGQPTNVDVPRVLGLVHVLTYDLTPGEPPELDRLDWIPAPSIIDEHTTNLHIFADPPARMRTRAMTLEHPTEAFARLISLVLAPPANAEPFQFQFLSAEIPLVEPSKPVEGLRTIELVSLAVSNLLSRDQLREVMSKDQNHMPGAQNDMSMGLGDTGFSSLHNCSAIKIP